MFIAILYIIVSHRKQLYWYLKVEWPNFGKLWHIHAVINQDSNENERTVICNNMDQSHKHLVRRPYAKEYIYIDFKDRQKSAMMIDRVKMTFGKEEGVNNWGGYTKGFWGVLSLNWFTPMSLLCDISFVGTCACLCSFLYACHISIKLLEYIYVFIT